ncbi:MAG: GPW/gp25 family protein [Herpetosiphon sp.]|nr:GPW/gp25 family protein [Herpetosiphon sp.]
MDAGTIFGRGMSFPPRVDDGRIVCSEGETNIREAIQIILLTKSNERLRLPTFGAGLHELLFEPNTVATHQRIARRITNSLHAWEPRIHVQSVDVAADPADAYSAIATIHYTLVATQAQERMSLAITLGQ